MTKNFRVKNQRNFLLFLLIRCSLTQNLLRHPVSALNSKSSKHTRIICSKKRSHKIEKFIKSLQHYTFTTKITARNQTPKRLLSDLAGSLLQSPNRMTIEPSHAECAKSSPIRSSMIFCSFGNLQFRVLVRKSAAPEESRTPFTACLCLSSPWLFRGSCRLALSALRPVAKQPPTLGFAISLHGNSILICPKLLMIESFSIARLARHRLFASNWFPVLDSCSATVFCDWCGPKMRPMTHNGHFWATFTLQVTHTCSRL